MKRKIGLLVLLLFSMGGFAEAQGLQQGNVTGKVVTRVGRVPIPGAKVTLMTTPVMETTSAADGSFGFEMVPYGVYRVTFVAPEYMFTEVSVRVDVPERDMNIVTMAPDMVVSDVDDSAFVEFDMDTEGDGMSIPGTLSASRDPFDNIAGYKFSSMRFRSRGYDTGLQDVHMNGIKLNDALNGYSPWSIWSGLNEATRNQEAVGGLAISDFGIGGVNGVTNIDARASMLRQGLRASVVHANAQYALRLMLTYASGMLDNGWAYAFSVSTRQGENYLIDGVYYNAWGYFAAVEKQFNPLHRLSFTFLGVPTKRGAQMAATQETFDLVRDNMYNPNWGWQNGDKRNSRVRNYHEPLAILNYNWDISQTTKFNAAASFRFGKNGYSALDWFDARDPKPDYHRNLPSYYEARGETDMANKWTRDWYNNSKIHQIDWDKLYTTNANSFNAQPWYDGDGNALPQGRAKYIVSERHTDQRDFNLKVQFTHEFRDNSKINAGANARVNRTEYYTSVKDLLGGAYWLNVDNFVQRDYGYNWDLMVNDASRENNLIAKKGDKYGYDYYAHVRDFSLWGIYEKSYRQWQGYLAGEVGYNTFWREGLYRKGLFYDNSYGDSDKPDFFTYKAKLGVSYRPSGIHHVSLNAVAMAEAPYFQNSFISPRTRNSLARDLKTTKTYGVDLNWSFRTPWLNFRLTGYYTQLKDMNKLISFYDDTALNNDGTSSGAFSNMSISGIDQQHYGMELGFRVPVVAGFSISGAVSIGDYTYSSNPYFTQTQDSSDRILHDNKRIIWDGFKVESTPQTAVNLSFNYRTESYWYFGIDFNYFDRMYLSMNPLARSEVMYEMGIDTDKIAELRKQEKFHNAIIANANIGKSWYIQRKYQIGFSFELKNFLSFIDNETFGDIKTGGFEQMRIRTPKGSVEDYNAFDSKYYYLPGMNYYLNIYFRF